MAIVDLAEFMSMPVANFSPNRTKQNGLVLALFFVVVTASYFCQGVRMSVVLPGLGLLHA
jgi:hypothetical protein